MARPSLLSAKNWGYLDKIFTIEFRNEDGTLKIYDKRIVFELIYYMKLPGAAATCPAGHKFRIMAEDYRFRGIAREIEFIVNNSIDDGISKLKMTPETIITLERIREDHFRDNLEEPKPEEKSGWSTSVIERPKRLAK